LVKAKIKITNSSSDKVFGVNWWALRSQLNCNNAIPQKSL